MWSLAFLTWASVLFSYSNGQYAYSRQQSANQQQGNGNGWDIRLAVPGEPGSDYPTLGGIPKTSFSCAGKQPGYYADLEASCQVFRICTAGSTYGFQSFLCPNGTLFNQQVFVCDWWMNVNCQESQKYFVMNNDKYGKLKLGPHMMSDIKNMLTHPMSTPYDKSAIKSKYVVMQEYKPPAGQLFPNGALRAGYERALSNVYVPPKQTNFINNNVVSASTPSPLYVPAAFNNGKNRDVETFQRQSKAGRLQNEVQTQQTFSNGHSGRITQGTYNGNTQSHTRNSGQNYQQYQNKLTNGHAYSTQNVNQNQLNSQYNRVNNQGNIKQSEFGISFKKEQFTYPTQQSTIGTATQQYSNENTGQITEAKQNLVSSDIPSTVITKTLTFDRLVNQANPTSRLTFKSWVVKPGKTAKLISEPGPYVYNKPNPPQTARLLSEPTPYVYNKPTNPSPPQPARLILEPTPYVYNKPTNSPKSARLVSEPTPYVYNKPTNPPPQQTARLILEPTPYVYNKPTNPPQPARLISEPTPYYYNNPSQAAKLISESGYVYNRPTGAKLIATTPSRTYLAPTTHRPNVPIKLYLAPTTIRPTLSGRLYLAPTTSRPFARQRQAPDGIVQPVFQSIDQEGSPTSPTPVYLPPNSNELHKPSFTFTKQSRINANHNNLTFTDILTKEKLDITVHDIVKDTSKVLDGPNSQLGQLREEPKDLDYPDETYLPPASSPDDHVENISEQENDFSIGRLGKLIAAPSTALEPPNESFDYNNNNQNPISMLPFYKEGSVLPANTIERTVSLKISIPEKTAAYLFKNNNDSEYDKLEILNTGSSNYLVLTNNNINKLSQPNFIPIGKLVVDKNTNISNSQALVYSFLADSLNAAKEYKNIVNENLQNSQQFNNEDISQISNKISQLTSSQYGQNIANTENYNNRGQIKYSNSVTQNQAQNDAQIQQNAQINAPISTNTFSSAYSQNSNRQTNDKQIYSGQLYQVPVPEVANQIYNEQNNFIALNKESEHRDLLESNQEVQNGNQQSSAEVEIVKSHSITLPSTAAKLQAATTATHNSHEDETAQEIFRNLINSDGITAQLRDKIIGSISHPYEDKKVVTYKKDQSYYLFTKLDENIQNQINAQRSGKVIQNNNNGNTVSLQFIPSVSFQVDDEKDQQRLLNAFQINEYGVPKEKSESFENRNVVANDVDYTINHVTGQNAQYRNPETLYTGPSSYSAPQATVGRLEAQQQSGNIVSKTNNDFLPARLEQFNEERGYQKVTPARQFTF